MTLSDLGNLGNFLVGVAAIFALLLGVPIWRHQKRIEARAAAAIDCRLRGLQLLHELRLRSVVLVGGEELQMNPDMLATKLRQQYVIRLAEADPFVTEARIAYIRAATVFRDSSADMNALEELMSLGGRAIKWAATSPCFLDLANGKGNDLGHNIFGLSEPRLSEALAQQKGRWEDLFGAAARYEEATGQLSRAAAVIADREVGGVNRHS